jgi:hypothetical protein
MARNPTACHARTGRAGNRRPVQTVAPGMMTLSKRTGWRSLLAGALLSGFATIVWAGPADTLRERHAALASELSNNAFQRPIHLESTQSSGDLRGDVHAVVDHPFATLETALRGAEQWCDILILHLNVKQCRAMGGPPANALAVSLGKKHDQPLSDAYRVDFDYRLAASEPGYMMLQLNAGAGPLGTRDYRIVVEAIPLGEGRSFLHMAYSYGYGLAARVAMQGYLSTIGSGKVGFSVVDRRAGQPVYVDNVRGVVERNTMRYYLAIDAYLGSLSAPPQARQERRLRDWFAATERYARQLHEIDQADYLAMKRKEIQRQHANTRTAKAE